VPFGPFAGFPFIPIAPLGWSGFWGPSAFLPPSANIVINPPVVLSGESQANPNFNLQPVPPPVVADDDLPPGAKPGDQIVIRPVKPLPLLPPPDVPQPLVNRGASAPLPPALVFDPFAAPRILAVEKPDPDPVKEAARLVKLAKTSFAAGEYGAAGEQFDRAIAVDARQALPVFLKAQTAFAAGRYSDAASLIRTGLELDRSWPSSPFDPKELYGANAAPFADHLAELRGVVAANPGEPTLEFLLGYELWFVGEKVEAKKWFDLAAKRLPAPGPIALFR
jgi:hypothetical protein